MPTVLSVTLAIGSHRLSQQVYPWSLTVISGRYLTSLYRVQLLKG